MERNEHENEEKYEEPSLEDFLPNEEDEWLKEKARRRRSLWVRAIVIILAFSLFMTTIQIWPQLFNLPSLSFLQKSKELSQEEDIQNYKQAVVTIENQYSKGTGFNVSRNGFIITNHHVIENMNPIVVIFPDGQQFRGKVVYSDSDLDIAFVDINDSDLPYLTVTADEWKLYEPIYVIGNPLLHHQIVNEGKIVEGSQPSGILMISAPVYKGNSGSPVINKKGEVIGIVFAKTVKGDTGLAVPIERWKDALSENFEEQ